MATPMGMLIDEFALRIRSTGWVEFCQYIYTLNPVSLKKFVQSLQLIADGPGSTAIKDQVRLIASWIHAAVSIPIVDYVAEPTLMEAFMKTSIPEGNALVGDFFQLPYPVVSLRIAGSPKERYHVFFRDSDNLFVLCPPTPTREAEVLPWPLTATMSELLTGNSSTDEEVRMILGVLYHLTHGTGVQERTLLQKGSRKKYRNRKNVMVIKGVLS